MATRPVPTGSCSGVGTYSAQPSTILENLRGAERAFVERKFRKALKLGNDVLQSQEGEHAVVQDATNCVHLRTDPLEDSLGNQSAVSVDSSFLIDLTSNIAPVDQAATVSLQCCYELSLRRSNTRVEYKGLEPFLDYYGASTERKRAMPLELAIVWIQFCHATGFQHTAVEMAAELLHVLLSSRYESISSHTQDGQGELLWFLSTKALPRAMSHAFVCRVFDKIGDESSWSPLQLRFVASCSVEKESVSAILSGLHDLSVNRNMTDSMAECISQCQEHLKCVLNELREKNGGEIAEDQDDILQIVPSSSFHNRGHLWQLPIADRDWQRQVAERILQLFRTHVVKPLWYDKERWENRGRVAIAAVMAYVAWKRRRRIRNATQSVGHIVFSPFFEIVRAFLPQRT